MHNLRLHLASGSPLLLGLNGRCQLCSNKLRVESPILRRLRWTQVFSTRHRERGPDGARFKQPPALIIANGQVGTSILSSVSDLKLPLESSMLQLHL